MRLAEQLGGWQTAPSLAASPWELCLQNILSRGLLVVSHSLYQCLGLVQLYTEQCPFTLVSQQNLSQGLL